MIKRRSIEESEYLRLVEFVSRMRDLACRSGWNGVENSKDLVVFFENRLSGEDASPRPSLDGRTGTQHDLRWALALHNWIHQDSFHRTVNLTLDSQMSIEVTFFVDGRQIARCNMAQVPRCIEHILTLKGFEKQPGEIRAYDNESEMDPATREYWVRMVSGQVPDERHEAFMKEGV